MCREREVNIRRLRINAQLFLQLIAPHVLCMYVHYDHTRIECMYIQYINISQHRSVNLERKC